MARQGSLCQPIQLARSKPIASGLRFVLTLMGLALTPSLAPGPLYAQAETVPSSHIHIDGLSKSILYAPDSAIEISARVEALIDHASSRLVLRGSLVSVHDGKVVQSHREIVAIDTEGNSETLLFPLVAPQLAGVYELRIDLSKDEDSSLWDRFRKSKPPLVQRGTPLIVVPENLTTVETQTQPPRSALLHLEDLQWVETLIAGKHYQPSSDSDFQITADPLTMRAQTLWTATKRLSHVITSSGLAGVLITVDADGKAWSATADSLLFPVGPQDSDHRQNQDLLIALMRAHAIQVDLRPAGEIPIVALNPRRIDRGLPSELPPIPNRAELEIARVLDRHDPSRMAINVALDDIAGDEGRLGKPIEQMLSIYAGIPVGQLELVPPTDRTNATVRVRTGTSAGRGYVSVLNLAPWQSYVDLEFDQKIKWELFGETTSVESILRQSEARPSHVRLTLEPGQLVLLASESEVGKVSIDSWSASVGGGTVQIEQIKRDVTSIVERIGLLADLDSSKALSNGGFEQSGGIGLVGWMHAQHPPGCVRIDSSVSAEGKQSVLLAADPALSSRTWIVSETIEPPDSGRLAVSLVIRADQADKDQPHPMRVSLEATAQEGPVRHSADFNVPRNGQWGARQIVLETDGVSKQEVQSLRLTIDSLAGGHVWLDDVRIHQWFPTAKEREQLESLAFLAVQGLQHGDLTPAAQLLQNRWARYLLSRRPTKAVEPAVDAAPADRQPGVAERIRSWLPKPIRF